MDAETGDGAGEHGYASDEEALDAVIARLDGLRIDTQSLSIGAGEPGVVLPALNVTRIVHVRAGEGSVAVGGGAPHHTAPGDYVVVEPGSGSRVLVTATDALSACVVYVDVEEHPDDAVTDALVEKLLHEAAGTWRTGQELVENMCAFRARVEAANAGVTLRAVAGTSAVNGKAARTDRGPTPLERGGLSAALVRLIIRRLEVDEIAAVNDTSRWLRENVQAIFRYKYQTELSARMFVPVKYRRRARYRVTRRPHGAYDWYRLYEKLSWKIETWRDDSRKDESPNLETFVNRRGLDRVRVVRVGNRAETVQFTRSLKVRTTYALHVRPDFDLDVLGELAALEELDMSAIVLTALPEAVGRLVLLRELDVSQNQLVVLPDALGAIAGLRTLRLASNELGALPDALTRLSVLGHLDISNNQFVSLPEPIGWLTSLRRLDVAHNRLHDLSGSVIWRLRALEHLDVSDNRLIRLPEPITRLRLLKYLDASENRIEALPDAIGQLAALETLAMRHNQLTALPRSVGRLSALRVLNVAHNRLAALPDTIGRLDMLRELWLTSNSITAFPASIERLARLHTFKLQLNPCPFDRLPWLARKFFDSVGNRILY